MELAGPVAQCFSCKRYDGNDATPTCTAFSGGIPGSIFFDGADHRLPIEGDGGLQYDSKEELTSLFDLWQETKEYGR